MNHEKGIEVEKIIPVKPPKVQLSLERTEFCRVEELRNYQIHELGRIIHEK
jgi:hypothetical protein